MANTNQSNITQQDFIVYDRDGKVMVKVNFLLALILMIFFWPIGLLVVIGIVTNYIRVEITK